MPSAANDSREGPASSNNFKDSKCFRTGDCRVGSTPTICAIFAVKSKDFTANIFLLSAPKYEASSLYNNRRQLESTATKIRFQKPFVARIVAHSS